MSKQIIKLTESDLHNIIQESVKKIISELDWKTYQNAAHKDYNPKRAKEFNKMAIQNFNNQFGYNTNNMESNTDSVELKPNPSPKAPSHLSINSKNGYKGNNSSFYSRAANYNNPQVIDNDYYGVNTKDSFTQTPKPYTQDKRHARKIQKAYDEYEKGNGWKNNNNKPNDFHDFLKYQ